MYLIVVILVLLWLFGGWHGGRNDGNYYGAGRGPYFGGGFGLIVVVLIVLWLLGGRL